MGNQTCNCQKDLLNRENENQFVLNNGQNGAFEENGQGDKDNWDKFKTHSVMAANRFESMNTSDKRDSVYEPVTYGLKGNIPNIDGVASYQGEKVNGLPEGRGREIYRNGEEYVGQFSQGQKNGFGIYVKPGKYRYSGNFKNNKMHGFGTIDYDDGSVYKGELQEGKYHGKGTFIDKNTSEKVGIWENGEFISPSK